MSRRSVFREQVVPIAWCCFFFAAVTVAAMILAGGAKADPTSDYAAINASAICSTIDDYPTVAGVTGVVQGVIEDSGMSPYDSGRAIATAVKYWCPRNLPVLQRFVAAYRDAQVMVA